MTIRGVQKLFREEGIKHVSSFSCPLCMDETGDEIEAATTEQAIEAEAQPAPPAHAARTSRDATPDPIIDDGTPRNPAIDRTSEPMPTPQGVVFARVLRRRPAPARHPRAKRHRQGTHRRSERKSQRPRPIPKPTHQQANLKRRTPHNWTSSPRLRNPPSRKRLTCPTTDPASTIPRNSRRAQALPRVCEPSASRHSPQIVPIFSPWPLNVFAPYWIGRIDP